MAEPENHTLKLLKEMREDMRKGFDAVNGKLDAMDKRLSNMGQAIYGESVMGRYMVAEVEERLEKIEKRLSKVEKRN